jgi:Domain of Unknown Function (DUF1259)
MKIISRYPTLIAFIIMTGLIAFPVINSSSLDKTTITSAVAVYAQSQRESQQQTSQPPEEQKPQTGTQYIFNNKSRPANAPEHCASLAKEVSGKGLPDYDLCDIVVYRQAPAITRNDGLVINNFSGIGHYIELASGQALNNTEAFQANTTNQNISAAFGEWALLDSEVVPVQDLMQKYNWTQTALHHHMLGETPKILFLHWSVTGNTQDLIKQAKEIIMQTSTYDEQQPRAPTSAGP